MSTISAMQGFCVIGVIILMGYLAAVFKVGGPTAQMVLQRFAFFVASPCLMFAIISKDNLAEVFSESMLVALGCALLTGAIFLVLARVVFKLDAAETTVGTLVSMYMNANNIGLPVATYILGDPAAVTSIILMQQVLFTPVALTALDLASSGAAKPKEIVKQLAHQPILIGVFAGMAVSAINNLTGVFIVPQFLYDPINTMGGAAVPLILAAFGMSLRGSRPFADASSLKATVTAGLLKCLAMPAFAFVMASALGLTGQELYACVILAALPTAQNVFNYAARYNAGNTFARDGVFFTTVLSPFVIIVIALLLG